MNLIVYMINILKEFSLALLFLIIVPPRFYYDLYRRKRVLAEIFYGIGLGVFGTLSILGSYGLSPDIKNDTRNVIVLIASSTNGWVSGLTTTVILIGVSLLAGEADLWVSIAAMLGSFLGGLLIYRLAPFLKKRHVSAYLLLGIIVAIGSAIWLYQLPKEMGGIHDLIAIPTAIIYGCLTWVFCSRFGQEVERNRQDDRTLRLKRAIYILRESNQIISKQTDEEIILRQICETIVQNGHYDEAWIGFFNHGTEEIYQKTRVVRDVKTGDVLPGMEEQNLYETELANLIVDKKQVIISNRLISDPIFSSYRDMIQKRKHQSGAWLPLIQKDEVLGVLAIFSNQLDGFETEEISLLTDLTYDLAYGILNLRIQKDKELFQFELEQSEKQLTSFFHVAPEAIMVIDREEARVQVVNDGFCRITGFLSSEVIGKIIDEVGILSDEDNKHKIIHLLQQTGFIANYETQFIKKTGEIATVLAQIAPINYEKMDCILIVGADITDIKKTEEALRLSEATFRMLINSTDDFVFLIDLTGIVLEANEVLATSLGITHEQIIGTDIYQYYPVELARLRREKAQEAIGLRCSVRFEDHSNNTWQELIISPVYNDTDEVVNLAVIGRDTTERKKAEESLQRSKEAYRHLTATLEQRVSERTREMEILYNVSSAFSSSLTIDDVMDNSISLAIKGLNLENGAIFLLDPNEDPYSLKLGSSSWNMTDDNRLLCEKDCIFRDVVIKRETLFFPDIKRKASCKHCQKNPLTENGNHRSFLGVPMNTQGRLIGVLAFWGYPDQSFTVEEIALIETLADQIAISIENTRLRQLMNETAVKEERARLARELHDSVTQEIYSLMLFTESAKRMFAEGKNEQLRALLDRIFDVSYQALKEMRLMVYDLHPIALEQAGLVEALRHRLETVEKRSGLQVSFHVAIDMESIPKNMSQELYRIAIEALNNATKHSRANRISVDLFMDQHIIELSVRDNGCGFDPVTAKEQGGMGLISLQERAKMLKGDLEIETSPGQGAYVRLRVPIP